VNGDSSQVFSLPGGPVRFVLGAEHREERAAQHADPISANSQTFFNAFSPFNPPAFKVTEGFGELELPILNHVPFADVLTVQGAARYSHYNTSAGNTWAWNINGVWGPVRDIKFRANYSKSVRVPTLNDLFSPASVNFGFVNDPCDVLYIGTGTSNRATNCAAQGIPAGFVNQPARSQTTQFLSAGNPNLTAETGKSLTVGTVITPRWVPGLSLTVDYYRITVNNLISVLGAQTILNQCYDLPQPNQYCSLINPRNADFTFDSPALISAGVNFAKQQANGIDFEVAYRRTFANKHRLNIHFLATDVLKRDNFTDPTNPNFLTQQLYNLGDPKWAANLNVGYGFGPVDFSYSVNYIGKQTVSDYANTHSVQGRPPQNADVTSIVWYPEVMYHSARVDFHVPQGNRKLDFYLGVDNMFDTKPPLGLLGTGGGEPYDPVGRIVYGGVSIDL
jgi:outer membrane receptor protein involved in Fe transport